ncbi:hypothetical protein HY631_02245 [Candidatus Uhrbacteria bacterium]|nr:hypothetical protein [Candidatus Uhrbacteria bacterium]
MRRLGYGEHRGHEGQLSYALRVSGQLFPRYHAYVEDRDGGVQVNLHVDQKAASYEGTSAHAGEYEGALVESEMQRIAQFVQGLASPSAAPASPPPLSSKKGFWG